MTKQTQHWDSVARRYVEGADPLPAETFGDVALYAGREPHIASGPKKAFADTFSAETVVTRHFFAHAANDNNSRRGEWMQTYSGRRFWPMDPRSNEVFIEDIAHGLSMQCRYAGHCIRFYSVAEHSVLIARWLLAQCASAETALWGLLHDASEAYLIDVPRPVKPFLDGYKAAESRVMAAVCDCFDLPREMPDAVHEADGGIINDERANMRRCEHEWAYTGEALGVSLEYWTPEEAESEFLAAYWALQGMWGMAA